MEACGYTVWLRGDPIEPAGNYGFPETPLAVAGGGG
jgi:hypothetical protein